MNDLPIERRGFIAFGGALLAAPLAALPATPARAQGGADAAALLNAESRAQLGRLSAPFLQRMEAAYGGPRPPALRARDRALVALASSIALGDAEAPFHARVRAALAAGVQPAEIVEAGLHATVYVGFPAAQAALQRTQAVFEADRVAYTPASRRPQGEDRSLGLANLRQIGGAEAAEQWRADTTELGLLTVAFAHGEIWNRGGLSVRDREIVTLAMSTANGNQLGSVRFHTTAARRLGWSREALLEALVVLAADTGWPRLIGAVPAVLEGLDAPVEAAPNPMPAPGDEAGPRQDDDATRLRRGEDALGRISQSSGQAVVSSFDRIAPDLGRYILEFSYGDVFARPGLDLKSRELATVAALTASGRMVDEIPLSVHVNGALNVGASPREVVEAILHMLPYVGFPLVQGAMAGAVAVFEERGLEVAPPRDPGRAALTIIGRLQAKPGRGQELRVALEPVVEASRREPGCINYDLHVSETNPDHFTIYENWVDQAALDLHFEQPHSRALAERLPELLATELTMERLTEISGWIGRRS